MLIVWSPTKALRNSAYLFHVDPTPYHVVAYIIAFLVDFVALLKRASACAERGNLATHAAYVL